MFIYWRQLNTGWWFGTMEFYVPFSWERLIIPTDELTPSFFRGVGRYTTNQNMKSPFINPIHNPYKITIKSL